jgi:hypothetical protein
VGLMYVSQSPVGEAAAIKETQDIQCALRFYNHTIGLIGERHSKQRGANRWRSAT